MYRGYAGILCYMVFGVLGVTSEHVFCWVLLKYTKHVLNIYQMWYIVEKMSVYFEYTTL